MPSAAVSDPIHPAFGQRERPGAEFEQLASGLERATEAPPNTERRSIARNVVCTIGSSRQTWSDRSRNPPGNLVALSDWTATNHACGPGADCPSARAMRHSLGIRAPLDLAASTDPVATKHESGSFGPQPRLPLAERSGHDSAVAA